MDKYPLPQFILPIDYDMMLATENKPTEFMKKFKRLMASKRHYTTIYISVFPKDIEDDRLGL
jgi:hypothetical protein